METRDGRSDQVVWVQFEFAAFEQKWVINL